MGLFGAGLVVAACSGGSGDGEDFGDTPLNSLSPSEQEQACDALEEERDIIIQASAGPLCARQAINQALIGDNDEEQPGPLDEEGLRSACVKERDACLAGYEGPFPACTIPEGCNFTLNQALNCYAAQEAQIEKRDDVPECEALTFEIARNVTTPGVTVSASCYEFSMTCRWASE